ncbi:MAG: DNA-directed RNA polymerase subunit N [Candidatus Micrarchaeota archaeon]|nr:DNA-directed RNA polymerase subunit N [Candidatus Micrarchaeota archaeon]MDE1859016.1 DNA-directed RNA polymerase subunit N [Candidatus Micrarchaeota archaeon]
MMIPIRCFSCGQVVGDKWEEYNTRVNQNKEDSGKVLEDLKVSRYCCRRMLVSHVDLIDDVINYSRK